jgi:hypothetical protein
MHIAGVMPVWVEERDPGVDLARTVTAELLDAVRGDHRWLPVIGSRSRRRIGRAHPIRVMSHP